MIDDPSTGRSVDVGSSFISPGEAFAEQGRSAVALRRSP